MKQQIKTISYCDFMSSTVALIKTWSSFCNHHSTLMHINKFFSVLWCCCLGDRKVSTNVSLYIRNSTRIQFLQKANRKSYVIYKIVPFPTAMTDLSNHPTIQFCVAFPMSKMGTDITNLVQRLMPSWLMDDKPHHERCQILWCQS